MFAVIIALGLGLVLLGAALLWAALTMPHLLALGVNIGVGLMTFLGGFLLLALGLVVRELRLLRRDGVGASTTSTKDLPARTTTTVSTASAVVPAPNPTPASAPAPSTGQCQSAAITPGQPGAASPHVPEQMEVRGYAVRVLADGGVEARLHQGWFRFESMNHLNEYLDALERTNIPGRNA